MLTFHPRRGSVLICDYKGFKAPEMIKARPVIVISPRFRSHSNICTVVPLSTTPPNVIENYHMKVHFERNLPSPFDANEHWIKADMLNTVSFERLSLIKCGKGPNGTRKYLDICLSDEQLAELESKIKLALGIKD